MLSSFLAADVQPSEELTVCNLLSESLKSFRVVSEMVKYLNADLKWFPQGSFSLPTV